MNEQAESRKLICEIVEGIQPFDHLESLHKADVIAWIRSGAPLFRVVKPAEPPMHLVTYFVVVDTKTESILLVDHLKAKKWLPTGGHVELNEDPRATVEREVLEELGMSVKFTKRIGDKPLFITSTMTVGLTAGHTDITLWYVLEGSNKDILKLAEEEFTRVAWFSFKEILRMDAGALDPHMHRFVRKLINKSDIYTS